MTAAKHTPGPWQLCYDGQIDGPNGETICRFTWSSFGEFNGDETKKANARLIAAAPETASQRDLLLDFYQMINGPRIVPPQAIHTYECPLGKIGKKRGPCNCGGAEIDEQIKVAREALAACGVKP